MRKMFGLLVILVLIWFGLSAYTGDGRGGIDLGSWLDPIGGKRDAGSEEPGFSEPKLASDHAEAETVPQAMKRRVSEAYQKSYDRVER